ncbi:hypothetical protein DYH09_22545 [bacterium CPR1]|nr:hypothetical protein [bacterium CPR1]
MDPSISRQAQQGLEASWATPLRFWQARETRTRAAEEALDRLEPRPEARPIVELTRVVAARAPERKLELYRTALETLAEATASMTAGPLAGLALKLLHQSEIEGEARSQVARELFVPLATPLLQTILAETEPEKRLSLLQQGKDETGVALLLPDPAPRELARKHPDFAALAELKLGEPDEHTLARCYLQHPDHWVASWAQDNRAHPQVRRVCEWALRQAPPSPWKELSERIADPVAIALEAHQPHGVEALLRVSLHSERPEQWLGELQESARHRPQAGALALVAQLAPERLREALQKISQGANADALASHFPELRAIAPREGFLKLLAARQVPEVVLERCRKASGEQPGNLAAIAFRSAGAEPRLGPKLTLTQLGLIELDRAADPDRKPATRLLWNLTRLHQKTPHPNALWLRNALALHGLGLASRQELPTSPRGLVELGLKMLDAPFMVPSWFAPAAMTVVETLQESSTSELEANLLETQRRKLTGRVQPEQARQVLVELKDLLESAPYRFSQGERRHGIAEEAESVIVGGIKVARRGQDRRAARAGEADQDTTARTDWPDLELDPTPSSDQSAAFEPRHQEVGCIQGVYNPNLGEVEWRTHPHRNLAGAYNPRTGEVEWQEARGGGIAALYDPAQGKVLFKTGRGSLQGLSNPVTGRSRFEAAYTGTRPGAANPLNGREHWESCSSGCNSGVFDPQREDFRFVTSYSAAIAAVHTDPAAATLSSTGTSPLQ